MTYFKPFRTQVGSDNASARPLGQYAQDDANGALADYQDGLALLQMERINPLHAGIDRLDKAGLLERNIARNRNRAALGNPIHHAHVLGKPPAGRLEACGTTDLSISWTLSKRLVAAVVALTARDVMEDHHPVAGLEILDALAHSSYQTGGLMAEDARRRMGAGGDLF